MYYSLSIEQSTQLTPLFLKHEMTYCQLSSLSQSIDHAFLLACLHEMYLIHVQARVWTSSYLSDRLQRDNINGILSSTQESVLGPILYCLLLNMCLTAFEVMVFCTVHMLITHRSTLQLRSKNVLLTNYLMQRTA